MRVRVRFGKTGKLRFISAIDLGRVWERALRKAQLPVAYSEGFSPHPKVSFGDALPLGFASTAEFAEITFAAPVDIPEMSGRLNQAFPDGIDVLDGVEVAEGDRRLGKLLQASMWTFEYDSPEGLADAVAALPVQGALTTQRERKGEIVTVDVRPALVGLVAYEASIRAVLHHPGFIPEADQVSGPAVRADDVHAVLGLPHKPHVTTRAAQGSVSNSPRGIADALRETTTPLQPAPLEENS